MLKCSVVVGCVVVVVTAFASPSAAHDFVVDQEAAGTITSAYSVGGLGPVGQEFVPQMSSLDAVELMFSNNDFNQADAIVVVRIRAQTIAGPILGTSDPYVLPYPTALSRHHLDFASPVALVPGQLYVMEVARIVGIGNVLIHGCANTYASGRIILVGLPEGGTDLVFSEGPVPVVPTRPSTWGSVKALYH